MTVRVQQWLRDSKGAWQSGSVELIVPGPSAAGFREWYADAMSKGWEVDLRAGQPRALHESSRARQHRGDGEHRRNRAALAHLLPQPAGKCAASLRMG